MKILKTNDINELRKLIQKSKKENLEETLAVLSQDDDFNRKALEINGLNCLIINEEINLKDYSKQRNSGLNEILAKIAQKNNILIGIELEKIIGKNIKEKAKSLARLKQNLFLCKKAKTKIAFILNKSTDKNSVKAILLNLKGSTEQAKKAIFLFNN